MKNNLLKKRLESRIQDVISITSDDAIVVEARDDLHAILIEILNIFSEIELKEGEPGKDGATPTKEYLLDLIRPLVPKITLPTLDEIVEALVKHIPPTTAHPAEDTVLALVHKFVTDKKFAKIVAPLFETFIAKSSMSKKVASIEKSIEAIRAAIKSISRTRASGSAQISGGGRTIKITRLTDGTTITPTDPTIQSDSVGNIFEVTIAGNRTISKLPQVVNGKMVVFKIKQSAGSNTITWDSAAGGYKFPSGTPDTLSTAAGALDYILFMGDSTSGFYHRLAFTANF